MYYNFEVTSNTKHEIGKYDELDHAKQMALSHSVRTGLQVEIENEMGKQVAIEWAWKQGDDYGILE